VRLMCCCCRSGVRCCCDCCLVAAFDARSCSCADPQVHDVYYTYACRPQHCQQTQHSSCTTPAAPATLGRHQDLLRHTQPHVRTLGGIWCWVLMRESTSKHKRCAASLLLHAGTHLRCAPSIQLPCLLNLASTSRLGLRHLRSLHTRAAAVCPVPAALPCLLGLAGGGQPAKLQEPPAGQLQTACVH
jgi:hypothetical protein